MTPCFIAGFREVCGASGRGTVSVARPHWPGRRRAEGASDLPERIRLGASAGEGHADAGGGFDDACGELDQAQPDGGELGGSQRGSRKASRGAASP